MLLRRQLTVYPLAAYERCVYDMDHALASRGNFCPTLFANHSEPKFESAGSSSLGACFAVDRRPSPPLWYRSSAKLDLHVAILTGDSGGD